MSGPGSFSGGLKRPCPWCGGSFTVVSAQKLLAGKKNASVIVHCPCGGGLIRPLNHEVLDLIRRHSIRLVKSS
jgi:hypothetical protein